MWAIDSGATHHMTHLIDVMTDFDESVKGEVIVADEREVSVEAMGSIVLKFAPLQLKLSILLFLKLVKKLLC